jgi:DNA-binding CsgD family transcriptional regulator
MTDLVGRHHELGVLAEHLDEAIAGRGSLVLVAGEPGIGKTAVADRIAADARDRGALALWGRCVAAETSPPFAPWIQVLRAWLENTLEPAVHKAVADAAPLLSRLVPELGRDREADPALPDGDESQFRLVEEVGHTLVRAASAQPIVIVVDDLQWSDVSSLSVLEAVGVASVDAALLVLGTYRDTEPPTPVTDAVARLGRLRRARSLRLAGLAEQEVRECLTNLTGTAVPGAVARDISRRTGGNPFFVTELGRRGEGADRSPEGVRAYLRSRLSLLPPATREILDVAAVFGRTFRVDWLADASHRSPLQVLDALDPAVHMHLIAEEGIGRHRFVHDLVREALLDTIPSGARAELHGRVGESIERLAGWTSHDHLDEIAVHYSEAARLGQVERAVESRLRAADRARAMLAHHEAAEHRLHACELARLDPAIDAGRRCDLLLGLGEALIRAGSYERADDALAEATDVARSMGDARRLAAAAMGQVGPARLETRGHIRPLIDEALAIAPADDPVLRARLVAKRAMSVPLDETAERIYWADRAWAEATAVDDALALSLAARARCWNSLAPGHLDEVQDLAARGLAAARRTGDLTELHESVFTQLLGTTILGDFDEFDRIEQERAAASERERLPRQLELGVTLRTRKLLLTGEFDAAESAILHAEEIRSRLGSSQRALAGSTLQAIWLRWWQRRVDHLDELTELVEAKGREREVLLAGHTPLTRRFTGEHDLIVGLAALTAGDLDRAGCCLRVGLALPLVTGRSVFWNARLALAAELALAVDDRPRITALRDALAGWSGLQANYSTLMYLGPCDFYLGRLEAAHGELGSAIELLEGALGFVDGVGARPQAMVTRAELATALQRRQDPGDVERADALLTEAAELARAMRLSPWARELHARLGAGDTGSNGDRLTAREHEIVELLATGRTNRQIADRLHLSVKTVERHLSNLYRKLGVANRTEAVTVAIRSIADAGHVSRSGEVEGKQ